MNSTPSIYIEDLDEFNNTIFMDSLAKIDPELWRIKTYLTTLKINPAILPPLIEQISKIGEGSGWGEVVLKIQKRRVIRCLGVDDKLLNLDLEDGGDDEKLGQQRKNLEDYP